MDELSMHDVSSLIAFRVTVEILEYDCQRNIKIPYVINFIH